MTAADPELQLKAWSWRFRNISVLPDLNMHPVDERSGPRKENCLQEFHKLAQYAHVIA